MITGNDPKIPDMAASVVMRMIAETMIPAESANFKGFNLATFSLRVFFFTFFFIIN